MTKKKHNGFVYEPKEVLNPSPKVTNCCKSLWVKCSFQKAYMTQLVSFWTVSAMSRNPDDNLPSQPKESSTGQQRPEEETVPKLAMQLRQIGDSIDHRMVREEGALASSVSPVAVLPPRGTQAQARCEGQRNPLGEGGICTLPGRLRIQPALWSREDVLHWLHWAEQEYALQPTGEHGFQMNGRALCILTKDDFRHRAPGSGDVLYELLRSIRTQRRALVCGPFFRGAFGQKMSSGFAPGPLEGLAGGGASRPLRGGVRSLGLPVRLVCPQRGPGSSRQTPGSPVPPAILHAPSLARWPLAREEPLNLSHCTEPDRGTQGVCSFSTVPRAPIDGRIADCRLLWDYVYQLLLDARYEPYIRWEDKDAKIFRVVDPNGLARLWGNHKNRVNMTYEKMSRALRHYYKLNILKKEPGQKLLFRFLKTPGKVIRNRGSCLEQPESPERHRTDVKDERLEISL
ncbi:Transcription factor ETV7 [Tupaia chinensis]|uniref:Transcription factor ETV7 n=1 Tax=Tupaia chinensis TaxID=246437 RepID=L9KTV4_TUPCH|nr:Transcription factor ETV7 [Tupaia chinensis]